jgi:hypothetical protein
VWRCDVSLSDTEHDLDATAALVAALIVFDELCCITPREYEGGFT